MRRLTKKSVRESRLEAARVIAIAQAGVVFGTDEYRMLQHAIWQILSTLHLERLPKYSVASELDADEWDAEHKAKMRGEGGPACEIIEPFEF